MSGDVIQRILEMACQWASNKAREIGEPWHFRVQRVEVQRHEWHQNMAARIELEGTLSETALKSMQVGPKEPWTYPEQIKTPPRAQVSEELRRKTTPLDGNWAYHELKDQLQKKEDTYFLPEDTAQTRAGVKALLQKYEQAIINAACLASHADPGRAATTALDAARRAPTNDPAADLLRKVGAQRQRIEDAIKDFEAKLKELNDNPDEKLRRRLRLKVRAQYESQERMLREFQSFVWEHYSCLLPENQKPNAVPEFLRHIEENDHAYSGEA